MSIALPALTVVRLLTVRFPHAPDVRWWFRFSRAIGHWDVPFLAVVMAAVFALHVWTIIAFERNGHAVVLTLLACINYSRVSDQASLVSSDPSIKFVVFAYCTLIDLYGVSYACMFCVRGGRFVIKEILDVWDPPAPDPAENKVYDGVECPVCLNAFDERERAPMAPRCGHVVCRGCTRLLRRNAGPSCRMPLTRFSVMPVERAYRRLYF